MKGLTQLERLGVFLDSLSWDGFWRMKGIGKVVKVRKGISGRGNSMLQRAVNARVISRWLTNNKFPHPSRAHKSKNDKIDSVLEDL